jgi:hypothetical protein
MACVVAPVRQVPESKWRLAEALEFLNGPDFFPAESDPARIEFARRRHFTFPTPRPSEDEENAGSWRWAYVVASMVLHYLNVFVLIVQAFRRVPALKTLAPTQSEPPFAIAQLTVLALFVVLTVLAAFRFRPHSVGARALRPLDHGVAA